MLHYKTAKTLKVLSYVTDMGTCLSFSLNEAIWTIVHKQKYLKYFHCGRHLCQTHFFPFQQNTVTMTAGKSCIPTAIGIYFKDS